MSQVRLKIFRGPEDAATMTHDGAAHDGLAHDGSGLGHNVTATVGEVLPLLADAIENQRTWLRDFEDDEITLSADLYEVLQAYQFFRRPSA